MIFYYTHTHTHTYLGENNVMPLPTAQCMRWVRVVNFNLGHSIFELKDQAVVSHVGHNVYAGTTVHEEEHASVEGRSHLEMDGFRAPLYKALFLFAVLYGCVAWTKKTGMTLDISASHEGKQRACIHMHLHICTHTLSLSHTHTHKRTCSLTHTHTCIHACTHACMHTHAHK